MGFTSPFLTAIVLLAVGSLAWRRRQQPGLASLAFCMYGAALWAGAWSMELLASEVGRKLQFVKSEDLGLVIFILAALSFAWQYPQPLAPIKRWVWIAVASPLILSMVLVISNDVHHLIYVGLVMDPLAPSGVDYIRGPLFPLYAGYGFLLMMTAIAILVWKNLHSRPSQRKWSLLAIGSLSIPVVSNLVYLVTPPSIATEGSLALSFVFCGLLLAVTVFADLEENVMERGRQLQETVNELQAEVERRTRLEADLNDAKTGLAQRLAEQSRRLAALYDVILLGSTLPGDGHGADAGVEIAAVTRIQALTRAQWVGFYAAPAGALHCITAAGTLPGGGTLPELPPDWLPRDGAPLVIGGVSAARLPAGLPAGLPGCGPVLVRLLQLSEQETGALVCVCPAGPDLSVEDTAIFDAACDLMAVILENDRLHRLEAAEASRRERRRLARDLHDSVTQSLHSLVLSADTAASLLGESSPPNLTRVLDHLRRSAQQALKEMRLLLHELRFVALEDYEFVDALQQRLAAVESRAGIDASLKVDRTVGWPPEWDGELYPLASEALNNALKHGCASHVTVSVYSHPDQFVLSICDDGRGFVPAVHKRGIGLASMAERAGRLGGQLRIQSAAGQGTDVTLTIARREADRATDLCPDC